VRPAHKMADYYCCLPDRHWTQFVVGRKRIDCRINDGRLSNIKVGDIICFRRASDGTEAKTTIAEKRIYPSLEAMLGDVKWQLLVPDARSDVEAVAYYHGLPTYTRRIATSGVMALFLC